MFIQNLINNNGHPFDLTELQKVRSQLSNLTNEERTIYRNKNALAIVQHNEARFLIVSGPGTGKSHLFMNKINNWYQKDSQAKIFVTSFVRKLVADLQKDIDNHKKLTSEQKNKITVVTLHKLARSIVEKNHGTVKWPFKPYFHIIGQLWKTIVWNDALALQPSLKNDTYCWSEFEKQLHNNNFKESDEWNNLKNSYFKLCQFYNAAGFADLILRATEALSENLNLNKYNYFIIDEYQDFNLAEDALLKQIIKDPQGLLIVGDDEQVLYEKLKSGNPTLIRNLYQSKHYANGMLPFCSRSSFHIAKAANYFINKYRNENSIEKIYLPIKTNKNDPKVQVVACATAPTAVDYIEKFIKDNKELIDERKAKLETGDKKDAYLLILTPAKEVRFYTNKKFSGRAKLQKLVSEYQTETRIFPEDYYQLLNYYSLAKNPNNNFNFRKVLHYEKFPENKVHKLIIKAMQSNKDICELNLHEIKGVLNKCNKIKTILDSASDITEKLVQIATIITLVDKNKLEKEIEQKPINLMKLGKPEFENEEDTELEEIEIKRMGAVELMTIIGSKGLSADHVIIIGFDNVNMNWITPNAFYVAMTRARKSLHLLTALKSGGAEKPHDFLDQLPNNHLEFFSYTKREHKKSPLNNEQGFKSYFNKLKFASNKK